MEPYRAGFTGFSKLVNSVLSDLGATSVKVKMNQGEPCHW
jgi:hypothetical protein